MATGGTSPSGRLPRERILEDAWAVKAENMPLGTVVAQGAGITQKVFGQSFGLQGGEVITGIGLGCNNAAAGTAPTTARFGLTDSTGKVLVLSANLNAAASWTTGRPLFPFTPGPFTIPADGAYYGCFVVNGTWSVTQPSIGFNNNISTYVAALAGGIVPAFGWAAQTDLPAIGASVTLTPAVTPIYYMLLY